MRFVAILALCLVAISTLVEGYREAAPAEALRPPPASAITAVSRESAPPATAPNDPSVASGAGLPLVPESPLPADTPPIAEVAPEPLPVPEPVREAPTPRPDVPDDSAPPEPPVLTLRFATDAALLRLVARGDAGVFVLSGPGTLMLDLADGVVFRPAPPPARYHSMTADTVPAVLKAAYGGPEEAAWGVTLPAHTLEAIDAYLARSESGVLVIDAQGRVALERTDE